MATPDIRVRLTAEGEQQVIAALRRVQAEAGLAGRRSTSGFLTFNSVLGSTRRLLGQVGAAFGIGALVSFIKRTAEASETTGNLSQRLGKVNEDLVALSLVAQRSRVDMELVAKSFVFLADRVEDVRAGSGPAAANFRQLGLTARDFDGRTVAQQYDLVIQRLATLEDSGEKALLTNKLLGRSGQQLIPLFNSLADGALARTVARMRALGISPRVIENVQTLDDRLDDLEEDAQLVGLAFTAGFAREAAAAIGALTSSVEGGDRAFERLGRLLGSTVRVALVPLAAALDVVTLGFNHLWVVIERGGEALEHVAKGRLRDAREALQRGGAEMFALRRAFFERAEARTDILLGRQPSVDTSRRLREQIEDEGRGQEHRLRILEDALQHERAIVEATFKAQGESQKRAFDEAMVGVRDFYSQRRELIDRETEALIAIERRRIDIARQLPDETERERRVADGERRIASLQVERTSRLAEAAAEERQTVRRLADERVDLLRRQLEAQGEVHAARMLEIDAEAEALDEVLAKQGVPAVDRTREVEEFRATLRARAEFDELRRQLDLRLNDLALERSAIERDIRAGRVGELEGERQILAIERQRLPALEAMAAALARAAASLGPDEIQAAREIALTLRDLGVGADRLNLTFAQMKDALRAAGVDALADALDRAATKGRTLREVLLDLVDAVRQITSRGLAETLVGAIGNGGGGRVLRRSSGGIVHGPGTPTSDSIPARLSVGEYVVRAAAVRQPGVLRHLEAINRMSPPTVDVARFARIRGFEGFPTGRRFAGGGLVTPAPRPSPAQQVRVDGVVTIEIPEGARAEVRQQVDERVLIRTVQRNAVAMRRALGL